MEGFSLLFTLSIYVVAAYFLRRLIFSAVPSLLLKSIASLAFLLSCPLAYFLLILFEKFGDAIGSEFDLGHANILAVVVGMGLTLGAIVFLIILWLSFFAKRKRVNE